MSIYDKLAVKRRDLTIAQAEVLNLQDELVKLKEGPGFAKNKTAIEGKIHLANKQIEGLNDNIRTLTSQLQPRLL